MASTAEFVGYVTEQLRLSGNIRAKRMFGEWGLFCDGLFFAVICDDQLFIKPTPEAIAQFGNMPILPPYEGAKGYILVQDVDNRELLTKLVDITCTALRGSHERKV